MPLNSPTEDSRDIKGEESKHQVTELYKIIKKERNTASSKRI